MKLNHFMRIRRSKSRGSKKAIKIRKKIYRLERKVSKEYIQMGKRVSEISNDGNKKINSFVDEIVKEKNKLRKLDKLKQL